MLVHSLVICILKAMRTKKVMRAKDVDCVLLSIVGRQLTDEKEEMRLEQYKGRLSRQAGPAKL